MTDTIVARVARAGVVLFGAVLLGAGGLLAVTPVSVEHGSEGDFLGGEFSATALTSAGEIRLGREVTVLARSGQAPAVVSALAVADKTIYLASGGDNQIYKVQGTKSDKFAAPGGTMVNSLLWTGKDLLAGCGGEEGAGLYRVDGQGKSALLFSDESVQYIWAIVADGQGKLFLATGPKARIYAVDAASGKGELLYEIGDNLAKNILCLVRDGTTGRLYAGTDENGLVLEVDPAAKAGRVILDAPEKEISAVALDGKGGVFAATSDAAKASSEGASEGSDVTTQPAPTTAPPATGPATLPSDEPAPVPTSKAATTDLAVTPSTALPTPAVPSMGSGGEGDGGGALDGPGNAVYHVAADGLARTLMRRGVSIHAMIRIDGQLLLGTGNSGQLLAVSTDGQDVTLLADTEGSQITALAAGGDGSVYFGTSNKGSLIQLGKSHAKEGTFTSKALDAGQIAKWGTLRISARTPEGAAVSVATRTGNLAQPNDKTWSPWSAQQPVTEGFLRIASPAGRFLQYRLTLKSAGGATPAATDVRLVYQVGNLAPEIASVTVVPMPAGSESMGGDMPTPSPAGGAAPTLPQPTAPQSARGIAVAASDANGDQTAVTIEYREVGGENWIKIADKSDKPGMVWDTRTVADGSYQLRVTVSDSLANPLESALSATKVTKPVVVDNTPPSVKDLTGRFENGVAVVTATAGDAASRIGAIHYSVDSATEWTAVLPADGICDSDSEKVSATLKALKPGPHRITLRVTDALGNTAFKSVTVTAK